MQRMAIGQLPNLFTATKAVRDDERIFRCASNVGKQRALAASDGNAVMVFLETECAGHAATARIENLKIETSFFQQFIVALQFHDRLVMTMAMQERPARQLRRLVVGRELLKELCERECLLRQANCLLVLREYLSQLVAENRGATWLKADHRSPSLNFTVQR